MDKKELWKLIDNNRQNLNLRFLDLDYVANTVENTEVAEKIIESNLLSAFENIPKTSAYVIDFLSSLFDNSPKNILDPWAYNGQFLKIFNSSSTNKIGYIINEEVFRLNEALSVDFKQVLGNSEELLRNESQKFDLIISNLPVKLKTHGNDFGLKFNDIGMQIIIQSLSHLSDKGRVLTTIGDSVFRSKDFINFIHSKGCKISAIFETPVGALNSFSRVPFFLMLIEKGIQSNVFLAEITDDKQHQNKVIENYNSQSSDKNLSKGVFKPIDGINSITKLNLEREVNILTKKTGIKPNQLTEFGKFKKLRELNQDDEFLLIPKFLSSKIKKATSGEKIKEIAHHIFVIDSRKVNIEYLSNFLNSELANKIFSSHASGTVIQSLSKRKIKEIELPIPDLKTQLEVVSMDRKLNDLEHYFNQQKAELWQSHKSLIKIKKDINSKLKKPDNIDWIEQLPFPLASIYWGYISESKSSKKVDYLFLFFEGLVEFLDTLMLSGLQTDKEFYNSTVRQWLKNEEYRDWHLKSSFGGWQNLFSTLASKIRVFYNNNGLEDKAFIKSLFSSANEDFFGMITSKKMTRVFIEVLKLRNNFKGHGGIMSDQKTDQILSQLETNFYEIKPLINDGFNNVKLIKAVPKSMSWNDEDNIYLTTCSLLKGTRSKFNQIEVQTNIPISENNLYLLPANQFKPIKMLPFVQMRQAPRTEHNACYFYNRIEGDKVRLVSYHYDKEEEVYIDLSNISSFLEILNPTD